MQIDQDLEILELQENLEFNLLQKLYKPIFQLIYIQDGRGRYFKINEAAR